MARPIICLQRIALQRGLRQTPVFQDDTGSRRMKILAAMFVNPFAAFWSLLAIYATIGVVVAIPFVIAGAHRIFPEPVQMSPASRIAILPGAIVLWPLVLKRWCFGGPKR